VAHKRIAGHFVARPGAGGLTRAITRGEAESGDAPFVYIINFADGEGFAVASGDRRLEVDVFAVTESGNIAAGDSIDNPGLALYFDALNEGFATGAFTLPDSLTQADGTRADLYDVWSYEVRRYYGAVLPIRWHQFWPYNTYCYTTSGKQALVGCVAVAVAQIMFATSPSTTSNGGYTFDWNLIRSDPPSLDPHIYNIPIVNMVARLMSQLGAPENLEMKYKTFADGGSGTSSRYVPRTFANFGYSNVEPLQDYNLNAVLLSLAQGKPVYISGLDSDRGYEGHAWVIDAAWVRQVNTCFFQPGSYQPYYFTSCYGGVNNFSRTYYVHYNWGWAGEGNGYFYQGVFAPSNRYANDNFGAPAYNEPHNFFNDVKIVPNLGQPYTSPTTLDWTCWNGPPIPPGWAFDMGTGGIYPQTW
jgi:hypothetical protein